MLEHPARASPNEVYNLAAQSFVQTSWSPAGAHRRDHRARRDSHPRRHPHRRPGHPLLPGELAARCSARSLEVPQAETTPFYPRSPYGVAKVYGHWITVNYRESLRPARDQRHPVQPRVASPRPRVRRPARSATASPASCSGQADELRLGNLEGQRDWGFAGDYVEAMWLMLQQESRQLRHLHRRDAFRPRVLRARVRPRRARLRAATSCRTSASSARPRSTCSSATRARRVDARLEAEGRLRGTRGDDGRRRPRAVEGRAAAFDRRCSPAASAPPASSRGLVQVVEPAVDHRHRQRRRRHRAARPAHLARHRHRHLHARRRHQPRDGLGPGATRRGRRWRWSSSYGGPAWFRLGDRDLGTHLYRTGRLAEGAPLSTVTAEIAAGVGRSTCGPAAGDRRPAADDGASTRRWRRRRREIGFQEYFVGRQHVGAGRRDAFRRRRPRPPRAGRARGDRRAPTSS